MKINERRIGLAERPFVVAEMSANHKGSLDRALELVRAAAECGVSALKVQTFKPETITIDRDSDEFRVDNPGGAWDGEALYGLYSRAQTPWEWHNKIFSYADQLGLIAFSTPFDLTAVDFLEAQGVPCYKIASFENVDLPLIAAVSETGKPVMISTGMSSISELGEAVEHAKLHGCKDLVILKCTSAYPSSAESANVLTIPHLRQLFSCEVGISDHTLGVGVAISAVAHGATVIEKHFTLDRNDKGIDSFFSMEPKEMKLLVEESERARLALGSVDYGRAAEESSSTRLRRSLYVSEDVAKGETITLDNIKSVRPGDGLSPKYLKIVLGRKFSAGARNGQPLTWNLVGEISQDE